MLRTRFLAAIATISLTAIVLVLVMLFANAGTRQDEVPARPIVVTPLSSVLPVPDRTVPPAVSTVIDEPQPLSRSEQAIRAMVAELSAHPALAEWVLSDRLVQRFAEAVEMVAGGMSPVEQLDFLRPDMPFLVHRRQGCLEIASSSYGRYDLAAEVFASLDTEGAVQLLRRLEDQITEAHHEVAWYDGDFESRLVQAMDHLLEVEVPEQPLAVRPGVLSYVFADDRLEQLSDAQRHLLRMGPRNASRVQTKLRQLRAELCPEPVFELEQLRAGRSAGEVEASSAPQAPASQPAQTIDTISEKELAIGLVAAP